MSQRIAVEEQHSVAAIFSSGIRRVPWLNQFLDFREIVFRPGAKQRTQVDVVLTWGNKETGHEARAFAEKYNKPLWRLEDGFFRSIHPGSRYPSASLILDTQGIYYDARAPSNLETLLQNETMQLEDPVLLKRAADALQLIRQERLSKYNNSSCAELQWSNDRQRVLVVDQTYGDASVSGGLASEATFTQMVEFALDSFPDAEIILKTHPDAKTGKKSSYLSKLAGGNPRVHLREELDNPYTLFEACAHVITATSQLGFEALIAGVPVTCFGAPFYAGWGLTEDRIRVQRRAKTRSLEQIAAAALIIYSRYVDPVSGKRCELERILEHFTVQRRAFRANEARTLAVKISPWKRPAARNFLGSPTKTLTFLSEAEALEVLKTTTLKKPRLKKPHIPNDDSYERLVAWGESVTLQAQCEKSGVEYVRMEDGFLRSAQLGSDLTVPLSLVLDRRGMYYDATRPSDLEHLLCTRVFTQPERERARRLRERLVALRLSKYNVQRDQAAQLRHQKNPTLLVIGQVADDASIRLGAGQVHSNSQLITQVRKLRPDAHLVYKPHPDVISGNRSGALSNEAEQLVDHIETQAAVVACLDQIDEVHTMTSLVGFEALLRNLPVFTYGMPFYAGWGLTNDAERCTRRGRLLELDELVYATLIAYPLYYSKRADCFVQAEAIVEELALTRRDDASASVAPSWSRKLRRFGRYLKGLALER